MSIGTETALAYTKPGSVILFKATFIGEVISQDQKLMVIRDGRGKRWAIHLDQLQRAAFSDFINDLASVIRHSGRFSTHAIAAHPVLSRMPLGACLCDEDGPLVTLVHIEKRADQDTKLIFEDINDNTQTIYLDLIQETVNLAEFIYRVKQRIKWQEQIKEETVLLRYFEEEFIPLMQEQLKYDHKRWGDSWLMTPREGQEVRIRRRFQEYFDLFEQNGKGIPWLKVAGYAVIAQAREDHPEWLL